jgi:hypothetical protein
VFGELAPVAVRFAGGIHHASERGGNRGRVEGSGGIPDHLHARRAGYHLWRVRADRARYGRCWSPPYGRGLRVRLVSGRCPPATAGDRGPPGDRRGGQRPAHAAGRAAAHGRRCRRARLGGRPGHHRDLVKEVVGEIWNETDRDVRAVVRVPDGSTVPARDVPDPRPGEPRHRLVCREYATVARLVLDRVEDRTDHHPGEHPETRQPPGSSTQASGTFRRGSMT